MKFASSENTSLINRAEYYLSQCTACKMGLGNDMTCPIDGTHEDFIPISFQRGI